VYWAFLCCRPQTGASIAHEEGRYSLGEIDWPMMLCLGYRSQKRRDGPKLTIGASHTKGYAGSKYIIEHRLAARCNITSFERSSNDFAGSWPSTFA